MIYNMGLPAVAQWIKPPTAVAQVAAEAGVHSLVWHSGLKDLALLQLQVRINSWPRDFHMSQVQT